MTWTTNLNAWLDFVIIRNSSKFLWCKSLVSILPLVWMVSGKVTYFSEWHCFKIIRYSEKFYRHNCLTCEYWSICLLSSCSTEQLVIFNKWNKSQEIHGDDWGELCHVTYILRNIEIIITKFFWAIMFIYKIQYIIWRQLWWWVGVVCKNTLFFQNEKF